MEMLIFIAMMLVIVVLQAVTPYVIRRGESFGVMVGEKAANSPDLRRMKRQFLQWNVVVGITITAVATLCLAVTPNESWQATIFIISIFVILIVSFLIYIRFYKASLAWKRENLQMSGERMEIVMVETTFHRQKRTISYVWYLIPLVLIFITIGLTIIYYNQIPSQIPMHYNFANEVTRVATKSYRTVMMIPVMQMLMLGLFMFINYMMSRSKQVIDNDNPTDSMKRSVLFRLIYSKFNLCMCILLITLFMVIQLSFIFPISPTIIATMTIAVIIIIFAGLIFLMLCVGQGGSRIKLDENPQENQSRPVRSDDENWKFGVFYFNRRDPAIFIEKRFGVGWTINMARPIAWISVVAIIAIIIVISILFS
ncbi:DUF1648 domain-containing protein [Listeria rocourtiae]|uniref:DUF1648 domain-containing protein n=1 Tax=Listeria rocourtiae TaxID=647910 RepID=UPI00162A71AB|nr:DUF5808 domain-containing protein [Listeria rocourtiae]MBC1435811.1 DUF1648 domain-containing protein [Listeria rocourtiae]